MAHINVCGWTKDNHDLRAAIINATGADVISICETHLAGSDTIQLEGYSWLGFNRTDIHRNAPKASGGVGILVKQCISENFNIEIVDKIFEGIIAVKFTNKATDSDFLVFSCYLPPENSTRGRDAQTFYSHLLTLVYLHCYCDKMFILGDFNARIGNLSDVIFDCDDIPRRVNIDTSVNKHGHDFIEFLLESKFCVLNGRLGQGDNYTSISRKGRAVVDYICVPHDTLNSCLTFTVTTVQEIADQHQLHGLLGHRSRLPDHCVILTEFVAETGQQTTPSSEIGNEEKFNLRRIPSNFMTSDVARTALLNMIERIETARETQCEIDAVYDSLMKCILDEMNREIPKYGAPKRSQKRLRHRKPYWCEELQTAWNNMRDREKNFLKCNSGKRAKGDLRARYIAARNSFDKLLKQCERAYRLAQSLDIESMTTTNPNDFWRKIKSLGPRQDKKIPVEMVNEDGSIVTDENLVFNRWKTDFYNLYNRDDDEGDLNETEYNRYLMHKHLLEQDMLDPLYTPNQDLNCNISVREIENLVMHAKSGSACGVDNIPYDVLKNPETITALTKLFQYIFDASMIPTLWRKAIICPILKDSTSDKRIPLNYRGISLLSCVSKLYSSFLNKRVTSYLEGNEILADEQNGFRSGRSCEDHIFTLNSIIKNNASVFTAFIDLKKCFDFIDRSMLLYKLLLNKIDGKVYNSIRNMYASTSSCIKINGKKTEWFSCASGVKQGCNLSPTLFSVFANDLVQEINDLDLGIEIGDSKVSLLMYADDIVLVASSEEHLQSMLNTLHDWCKRCRVLINTTKSKCMHLRKGRTPQTVFDFKVGDNSLELVEQYKYLGVVLQEKGNFRCNAETLSKGASRALGSLINKIHHLKDVGFRTYEKLYYSCVVPILDYSSTVWGYSHFQCIDNVQHRALRYFLGVGRFAPTLALYGDTGWLPCKYRRWGNVLRYWNRLIKMDNSRLTKRVFEADYVLGTNNWCNDVREIMEQLNIMDHYNNKTTVDLACAKRIITEHYGTTWSREVQTLPKLRTYRTFKNTFKCEDYVMMDLKKHERSIFAQFRCGILPLRIETGRYVGESPDQRLCVFCDQHAVEDEKHMLIHCDLYNHIRADVFGNIHTDTLSADDKFVSLVNEHVRKTAKFLTKAYLKRRSCLYS